MLPLKFTAFIQINEQTHMYKYELLIRNSFKINANY
jgi:hypothetical protein